MEGQYDNIELKDEYRQCLNVECKDGELLKINGNVIVGIAKSKKIELEL
ncbi:MAG: hypothetical protein PHY47_27100 [Lachnospiraceae bacterium]|nr:hypothetical protein [Lachnospiraceae bacterium]